MISVSDQCLAIMCVSYLFIGEMSMKATLFCNNVTLLFVGPLYASVHFQIGIVS